MTCIMANLFIEFLSSVVSSLKCHHCLSSSSLADCSKSSKRMSCPEVADCCASISTELKSEAGSLRSFFYGCASKKMCHDAEEQLKVCEKMNQPGYQVKCNITCCKGDFCIPLAVTGSGVTPVFGRLLVVFCVILTLFSKF